MKKATPPYRLEALRIAGFKSFDGEGQELRLGNVTVLIGNNGAGKSNVVGVFDLLQHLVNKRLQDWVGRRGFASSVLRRGNAKVATIALRLTFRSAAFKSTFHVEMGKVEGDRLAIVLENEQHVNEAIGTDRFQDPTGEYKLENGYRLESTLFAKEEISHSLLHTCRVYHFHDTTPTAAVRSYAQLEDNRRLHADGGNIAAFLYRLQQQHNWHFQRIERHIRTMVPSFQAFALAPAPNNEEMIRLAWTDGSDHVFGPHQLSDGTVRFICLITLLYQPRELRPALLVIDEPELGLHPSAIAHLGGLIRAEASEAAQIVLATQSPYLLNAFTPDEIVLVDYDRNARATRLHYPDSMRLKSWMKTNSTAELWDQNLLRL